MHIVIYDATSIMNSVSAPRFTEAQVRSGGPLISSNRYRCEVRTRAASPLSLAFFASALFSGSELNMSRIFCATLWSFMSRLNMSVIRVIDGPMTRATVFLMSIASLSRRST